MFDIGFTELLLVAIVALLVLGPERLPQALRTLGLWIGRMRRSFNAVRDEIEREIGMDEIRRQLHNEAVMEELRRIEQNVKSTTGTIATTGAAPTGAAASGSATAADASSSAAAAEVEVGPARNLPVAAGQNPAGAGDAPSIATPEAAHADAGATTDGGARRAGH
jgi:sec-independent protein translocase protein TatB